MMNTRERVKNIFRNANVNIDAILIKNGHEQYIDTNFFYVTGLTKGLFEDCCLVLFPDGTIHLLVTALESDIAKQSSASIHIFQSRQEMVTILNEILVHANTIGINESAILHSDYQWISTNFKEKNIENVITSFHKSRRIKEPDELNNIKKACGIADQVMGDISNYVKKNMTENELAAEIDYHLQRYGAQNPAFDTIASFGPNTAMPHYTHDNTKLKEGDFVLCDFGASFDKYNSDMTRTFVYGSASEKQKKIHETVRIAQQKAMMMIKPGIQAKLIHEQAKSYIDSSSFKDCFIHSTGHSLGLSVHDPGVGFYSTCEETLRENMVLTVEPGIYIQGYGGVRIEDDIVITKEGCTSLTKSQRTLQEI